MILHEVAEAKAHAAGHGETQNCLSLEMKNAHCNPSPDKVTVKILRYRCKKLQKNFPAADDADRRFSRVGGEMGEMDELLGRMEELCKEKNLALNLAHKRQSAKMER